MEGTTHNSNASHATPDTPSNDDVQQDNAMYDKERYKTPFDEIDDEKESLLAQTDIAILCKQPDDARSMEGKRCLSNGVDLS